MANAVEEWKKEKHGFDVWKEVLAHASAGTAMKDIPPADLERMKWHGVFYRKRDAPGTYMLRIRITACELSAWQAKTIARIAYDHGYGIVDVTTRANIQVQGLDIDDVPRALERLAETGLTCKQTGHDNVRNVFGHPFSGIDPDEIVDTRTLCRQITEIFLDHRDYADLPRKFNIAVCGRPEHAVHYWTQDLAWLAARNPAGKAFFRVLIGGKQGQSPRLGWHLPVRVEPDEVVLVTRALLDLFREKGLRDKRDGARFRFLIEKIGLDAVLDEVQERLGRRLPRSVDEPIPPSGYEDLVGWFKQKTPDRWIMGLCPLLGRMSWQQLEGIAVASERWGSGQLRTTPEQGIAVIDIPTGFRDAIATDAARFGLSVHADSLERNMVACTGKQFCNIAVSETKGHALRLIDRLRQRSLALHGIRIHMSGCPSACGNHHTADIGLKGVRVKRILGTREGFDVYLGGGVAGRLHLGMPYRLGVDVEQLPQLIDEVVKEYYLQHSPGQSFSAFWRERLRDEQPAAVAERDYLFATWECENCQYRHLGEDPPVYCPKCAALRRHFARLEDQAADKPNPAEPESAIRPDGYCPVGTTSAIPADRGLLVRAQGQEVVLCRAGDAIHAIGNSCPHEGGSLSEGSVRDGILTCPLHGWKFDVRHGGCVEPEKGHAVTRFPVRIEGDTVLVRLGGTVA